MPPKKKQNRAVPKTKSELETRLKQYEKLKAQMVENFEKCKDEWVRNDLEWLSLMNLAAQANNANRNNRIPKQETTDSQQEQEVNVIPITVKSGVTNLDKKDVQCKVEVESCDADCNL